MSPFHRLKYKLVTECVVVTEGRCYHEYVIERALFTSTKREALLSIATQRWRFHTRPKRGAGDGLERSHHATAKTPGLFKRTFSDGTGVLTASRPPPTARASGLARASAVA